jgi:hypothetical protein
LTANADCHSIANMKLGVKIPVAKPTWMLRRGFHLGSDRDLFVAVNEWGVPVRPKTVLFPFTMPDTKLPATNRSDAAFPEVSDLAKLVFAQQMMAIKQGR